MLLALVFLAIGTVVILVGAKAAVRGAIRLAATLGVSAFVVGALAFGIDIESLAAGLLAAGREETGLAAGEIYGTILFMLSAAFGAALLVSRGAVPAPSVTMLLAPALPLLAGGLAVSDARVDRLEGGLLILMYAGYVGAVLTEARSGRARPDVSESRPEPDAAPPTGTLEGAERRRDRGLEGLGVMALGLVAVLAGAWLLVEGGIRILERTGLAAGFVGAAIIASLAAFDEVFLEILPIRSGEPGLATGNLYGTVAAFTTFVPGLAALIRPLELDAPAILAFLGAAILYALITTVLLVRSRAGRGLGVVVLGGYAAWLAYVSGL